jgi:hypothetical protein
VEDVLVPLYGESHKMGDLGGNDDQ